MKTYANRMNFNALRPECGPMYSKNLYCWLRNHRASERARMYLYKHSDGDLYIGEIYDGDLLGSRLNEIVCKGGKAKRWCFAGYEKHLTLDKHFWSKYKEIGKCAFDPAHNWYPERYRKIDDTTRQCVWCGRVEKLRIERKIVEVEVWESAPGEGNEK